ncbi:MAG: addiction module protein [Bacteroidetes bacterium]|nr:addiction module protein [Bacteroidota bacterium]
MSVEELKEEALRLGPEARAYLARELVASLEGISETEIEGLWIDEAMRRDKSIDNGSARAYAADEVLARARARRT